MWIFLEQSIFRHMVTCNSDHVVFCCKNDRNKAQRKRKSAVEQVNFDHNIYRGKRKGNIYGSDIYERKAGFKTDFVNGAANGAFYDGQFTL